MLLPGRVAAFDVDAQKGFTPLCPDELPVPRGDEIVAELNAQARFACWRLGSKDAHSPYAIWRATADKPMFTPLDAPHADTHWDMHCVPGTKGFELLDGLPRPADYDFFVWKGVEPDMHPYGACYHDLAERRSTGVLEFLRSRDVQAVIVGGLALDYCVKSTALQLRRAGLDVIVNLAACRAIAPDTARQAMEMFARAGVRTLERAALLRRP
ncbi:isochorismatase family protein [Bordetella pseudohinzii]|uniref:nicotinamidase n=1 Tax=Bordetella pseudohinzii TaxID=1331258 RepID=A0A0J6BQZ7_9BORD|nr:isochorismatase family protein [Bordetella pseudohinzii]ANY15775.1 nicotinamidase [Bordetella pseudohinzii]KMM24239.1 amidase [Bordetella pseudohinzii]KXA78730.1 nicotinamidase [Bordetella pseudohinzii]KXA81342.1 nicotinamidase [Bordetella pseudohinzii]CUI42062.1 nicotinamidase/pyrazinamidase [Bordetella pseudohinzii]